MANTNLAGLYANLKRNTDSSLYLTLVELLEFKLSATKDQMVTDTGGVDSYRVLQGRAMELKDILDGLKRIPVATQKMGGYGQ